MQATAIRRFPLLPGLVLLSAPAVLAGALAAAPAVTEFGQGINAYNARDFASAVSHLKAARGLTAVSDYVAYHLAYSEVLTGDLDGALALLKTYRADPVKSSPLEGKLDLLYGRTLLDKHDPALAAKALNSLQSDYKALPQPDGDFALGLAYEAAGEQMQAALAYERVYYSYPDTDLAAQSSTAIERLKAALGHDFPEAPARQQLDRCDKWLAAKQYGKARDEYEALAANLTGPERDDAKVGIGASDYLAGKAAEALRYLQELNVMQPEADAERLFYVEETARKTGDDETMAGAVKQLGEKYPKSVWRVRALVAAGERFVVTNERDKYIPMFKAVADDFPEGTAGAFSHWKLAWDAYQNDKPEKVALLREHVERYTNDAHASSALYFLGRVADAAGKHAEARAYYERLNKEFPHYFYAVLARQRLKEKAAEAGPREDADAAVNTWLDGIAWPTHRDFSASEPNTATARRIARARILNEAGLPDLAESELRFGAKDEDEQPQLLAMELARTADSPYHSLRIMKSFSADYLALPVDKAPAKFWQMLFPLPYKDALFLNARERGLDPYDVAALIRQESEFNPGARSRANAYGLMQLLPSTGRMVGRQQGMRYVSTRSLLNPSVSIQLGTHYLRQQLDNWDGDFYRTLAAYNAGPGRVHQWLTWSNYSEPAEFVESIPFDETREYVQAVLRNADLYREIYSGRNAIDTPESHKPAVKMATLFEEGGRREEERREEERREDGREKERRPETPEATPEPIRATTREARLEPRPEVRSARKPAPVLREVSRTSEPERASLEKPGTASAHIASAKTKPAKAAVKRTVAKKAVVRNTAKRRSHTVVARKSAPPHASTGVHADAVHADNEKKRDPA